MEDIVLKPKKKNLLDKIKELFSNKKKRALYVILFILPFLIAMGVFGYIAYRGVENILALAKGESEVKDEYHIKQMNYALRSNATDIQKQYFAELKQAIEVDNASDEVVAGLVCKNFVADFYTWTNKQGQYDISALYYVYTPDKETIYINARDGFYKYINNYIDKYGQSNLLEVESVEVSKTEAANYQYEPASGEVFDNCYNVTCKWTYKANDKFSTSGYDTSMYFLVVKREGRFEIVEASGNPIDARKVEVQEDDE